MAEILSVEVSSFFMESLDVVNRLIFPAAEAVDIKFHDLPEGSVQAKLLTPVDFEVKAEPYLVEIPSNGKLPSHFFIHKGEELGYLLSGELQIQFRNTVYNMHAGDAIYLTSEIPSQWKNPGSDVARLIWIKVK